MAKLGIEDLKLAGKKVLIRVDFNVPILDGKVANDQRIVAALPTIRYALEKGAAVILMSHLGRPKGERKPEFSLRPVREALEGHLGRPVKFAEDCVGPAADEGAGSLRPGEVLLLENLRFHSGEEKPDEQPEFADALARLGDCYVNDAFGTAHRSHTSMVGVAERFGRRAAGFLLAKELKYFRKALYSPEQPFLTLLGGAKVGDKIPLVENLLNKVDVMLIGGAMAYTFLRSRGVAVGASRVEEDKVELAKRILAAAKEMRVELLLPLDHVCGKELSAGTERRTTADASIPEGWIGLDIGPATVAAFEKRIRSAKTLIWNGPMGVFEWEPFASGTMALARACAESGALTIVGGGDTAAAAEKSGLAKRFDHISTGGGASLELLEGRELPGVAILSTR